MLNLLQTLLLKAELLKAATQLLGESRPQLVLSSFGQRRSGFSVQGTWRAEGRLCPGNTDRAAVWAQAPRANLLKCSVWGNVFDARDPSSPGLVPLSCLSTQRPGFGAPRLCVAQAAEAARCQGRPSVFKSRNNKDTVRTKQALTATVSGCWVCLLPDASSRTHNHMTTQVP